VSVVGLETLHWFDAEMCLLFCTLWLSCSVDVLASAKMSLIAINVYILLSEALLFSLVSSLAIKIFLTSSLLLCFCNSVKDGGCERQKLKALAVDCTSCSIPSL
jgi:hypothetical protein